MKKRICSNLLRQIISKCREAEEVGLPWLEGRQDGSKPKINQTLSTVWSVYYTIKKILQGDQKNNHAYDICNSHVTKEFLLLTACSCAKTKIKKKLIILNVFVCSRYCQWRRYQAFWVLHNIEVLLSQLCFRAYKSLWILLFSSSFSSWHMNRL